MQVIIVRYTLLGLVIIKTDEMNNKPQQHKALPVSTDLLSCRPPAHTVMQQGFIENASASAETR